MSDKITSFKQVEEVLDFLGDNILELQEVILIGGAAFLEYSMKKETKDIDLVMKRKTFEDIDFDLRFLDVWTFRDSDLSKSLGEAAGKLGPWDLRRFMLEKDKHVSFGCTIDVFINDQLYEELAKEALSATLHGKLHVERLRYDKLKTLAVR